VLNQQKSAQSAKGKVLNQQKKVLNQQKK